MNQPLRYLAYAALAAALICPLAFVAGAVGHAACKAVMLVATVVWFAAMGAAQVRSVVAPGDASPDGERTA